MKLVITEKPSVAQTIAKVLRAAKRSDGFLEGNGYIVSWCIGHLIELAEPDAYDAKYRKWNRADLPILPEHWQYLVSESTRHQYDILSELMHRDDVSAIINACDAGREGELIFRLVYQQCHCTKPIERLWISSLEDEAVLDGFENLRPGTEFDALYQAALCRERADWLIGMNATRLLSCMYDKTLNIGRVMTPTLAMVVLRDAESAAFQPETFFTVELSAENCTAVSQRFSDQAHAKALLSDCVRAGSAEVISIQRKERTEHPPTLYDLTTLQRDANRILGFTAQQTLDYAQSLYEKKLITYPRSDSCYLTNEMGSTIQDLAAKISELYHADMPTVHSERTLNSSKVTDHHAIIPTVRLEDHNTASLPAGEQSLLQLIAVRTLCAVSDDCRCAETDYVLRCADTDFTRQIKAVIEPGWRAIQNRFYPPKKETQTHYLPSMTEGSLLTLSGCRIKEGKTSPPKRFTEDTLLSSMQLAAKEDMPEDAEHSGIGTPATRAGVIEKLIQKGYLERRGEKKHRYLTATEKGNALITVVPELLQSASMTADWEHRLIQIERGEYSPKQFMEEIQDMICKLVATSEVRKGADILMAERKVVGMCPHCHSEVIERQKGWFCSNRSCRFVLWKDNAFFKKIGKHLTGQIVGRLLRDGHIRLKDCMNQATGKAYNATLEMTAEEDGRPVFFLNFENRGARNFENNGRSDNRK